MTAKQKKQVHIYCDGGAHNRDKNGIGAYGVVVVEDGELVRQRGEAMRGVKSGRMEVMGLLYSIDHAVRNYDKLDDVTIFSDSRYCVDAYNKWLDNWSQKNWKRYKGGKVEHSDLWQLINTLKRSSVKVKWVKGHSGNIYNEMADDLVGEKMTEFEIAGRENKQRK